VRGPEAPPSVQFRLGPSRALALAMVTAHAAAGCGAALALGGAAGPALGAAVVLLGLAGAWGRALLRSPSSVRVIDVRGEEVRVTLASGAQFDARVAPRRYVSRWLVVLVIVAPVRRTVLITSGMLTVEPFRRLRVWGLWGRMARAPRSQVAFVAAEQLSR
jgi:hypothetical protein